MTSPAPILEGAMETRLLVGRGITGAALTDVDDSGGLGRPGWDPARLLADLELRLGIDLPTIAPIARVQAFSARMSAIGGDRFYTASYRRDPIGTAAALLDWRDELIAAGWDGEMMAEGGARLAALAELEAPAEPALPPGAADRLHGVALELERTHSRLHDAIALIDDPALWPATWRRILAALAGSGTRIERALLEQPIPGDSDLGRLQACLAGSGRTSAPIFSGDGSVLVLRADTSSDAARATAALLDCWGTADTVVVRGGAPAVLDVALAAQGLAPIGTSSSSALRPALQVLPLAVELVFEPKDPHRVLDLLTLPVGPFHSVTRRALARAMSDAPGIGSNTWRAAVEWVRETILSAERAEDCNTGDEDRARRARRQMDLIATWFETPGHDRVAGAPRQTLASAGQRVAEWARGHLAARPDDPVLLAAHRQAQEFITALAVDPRDRLDLVAARHLLASTTGTVALAVSEASAGQVEAVDYPGSLLRPRGAVFWWHFTRPAERSATRAAWREHERAALAAAGVDLVRPAALLAADAAAWRRPVLLAARRLVLVVPSADSGAFLEPHPLWSEIEALTGATDGELSRITVFARDLLAGRAWCNPSPKVETIPPLALPRPRLEWRLPAGVVGAAPDHSASSLELLVGCPLRFVFERAANVRSGRIAGIPPTFRLAGTLGHRLIEELEREGAFGLGTASLARRAGEIFDSMLPAEGATLLLDGASFERSQIRTLLVDAVVALDHALAQHGLRIAGVEVTTEEEWRGGTLSGRIDLLAQRPDGSEVVLDLKWGRSSYRDLLVQGRAVQLATYAHLRQRARPTCGQVPAAYFSLSRAQLLASSDLALPGRHGAGTVTAADTWQAVERTVLAIETALAAGRVLVTGLAAAAPIGKTLGRDDLLAAPPGSACRYCRHDGLCGRRWETRS